MKTPEVGLSFCTHIRQQVRGWQEPVLAAIWIYQEQAIRSAYDAGATDILPLPCHRLVLQLRLRCAIRAHRMLGMPQVIHAENASPPHLLEPAASSYSVARIHLPGTREVPALPGTCASFPGMPDKGAFESLLRGAITSSNDQSLTVYFMEIEDAVEGIDNALERVVEVFIGRMTSRYFPVGHLGPRRFTMLLVGVVTWSEVRRHALSIINDLAVACGRDKNHAQATIKIGVSVSPDDGTDAAVLLKKAEIARYLVNEPAGTSGFHFYSSLCTDSSVRYDSLMIT
ncbi:hypothetical protein [Geomonas paludis]|nr:hypothetical protein [Geomonas paludis]